MASIFSDPEAASQILFFRQLLHQDNCLPKHLLKALTKRLVSLQENAAIYEEFKTL